MERLIDADALKEAMNQNGACGICLRYVDDADTINAIPMEWLRDKYKTEPEMLMRNAVADVMWLWRKEQEVR